ncbi:MAG TPA: DUF4954 family protein, partial [Bacteroidales bacterium]|nr:DUF4954 family protein [Bacteroidales bacterium]
LHTGYALAISQENKADLTEQQLILKGRELLSSEVPLAKNFNVTVPGMEHSERVGLILKPQQAWRIFNDMINCYVAENILESLITNKTSDPGHLNTIISKPAKLSSWLNVGGQLIKAEEVEKLRQQITDYEIISWDQVHNFYAEQSKNYTADKLEHALAVWQQMSESKLLTKALLAELLTGYLEVSRSIVKSIRQSRLKDYTNPYRQQVYENFEEMEAVLGKIDETSFIIKEENDFKGKEELLQKMINELIQ